MCTHKRLIYNKYVRQSMFVDCGKCVACEQSRSNHRAQLIRNHNCGMLCLFVTLTYDNHYIPYVKKEDIFGLAPLSHDLEVIRQALGVSYDEFCAAYPDRDYILSLHSDFLSDVDIPVYRDYDVRWFDGVCSSHRVSKPVSYIKGFDVDYSFGDYLPFLRKKRDCIGIALYSDFQKFLKRLRINIDRHYYDSIHFDSFYAVSEYGGTTYRPHFHCLLYFDKGSLEEIRPLLVKSWPYGDLLRTDKRIQIAINPASYLAGYLNKSAGLPKICKSPAFDTSSSHSQFFGFGVSDFSLDKVLEKVERHDLSYTHEIIEDGVPRLVISPLPNYVINRYFPKFKGYSLFTPAEVRKFLLCPAEYWFRLGSSPVTIDFDTTDFVDDGMVTHHHIYYSPWKDCLVFLNHTEYRYWLNKLLRAYEYYYQVTGKSIFDYVIDYERVWTAWHSTVLRLSLAGVTDFSEHYMNIDEYYLHPDIAPTLSTSVTYNRNYNTLKEIVLRDRYLRSVNCQQKEIRQTNGLILSELYDDM